MARWGMPSPLFALKGRNSDPGVTNIRNASSPHWRRWLGVESRCAVPFSSFSENEAMPDGSRPPVWFAFDESRPLVLHGALDALEIRALAATAPRRGAQHRRAGQKDRWRGGKAKL